MIDVYRWEIERILQHIDVCNSVLTADPWNKTAKVQKEICEAEIARRAKPKEPDICDIIAAESE